MLAPGACAHVAMLPLSTSVLAAMLISWAQLGEGVPEDSPLRAEGALLDLALRGTHERLQFKEGLAADLLAGRLPLREAAARLDDYLGKGPPPRGFLSGHDYLGPLPGATPEARCAADLVGMARARLPRSPGSAGRVATLERELAEAYRR